MILGGTKGRKIESSIDKLTKYAHNKDCQALFRALKQNKLLQLLIIISKCELVHSVAVTSRNRAAFGNSEPPAVLLETALPTGVGKRCHSMGELVPKGQQRLLAPVSCNSKGGLFLLFC